MTEPFEIRPNHVFDKTSIRAMFDITWPVLQKATCAGKLKSVRIGDQNLYLGAWLLEWFAEEEKTQNECRNAKPTSNV